MDRNISCDELDNEVVPQVDAETDSSKEAPGCEFEKSGKSCCRHCGDNADRPNESEKQKVTMEDLVRRVDIDQRSPE